MERLREVVAVILFATGIFSIINAFIGQFDLLFLLTGFACLVLAYFIWPSKKNNYREDNIYLDALEFAIELPFDILFWVLRSLIKIFRKADLPDIDV